VHPDGEKEPAASGSRARMLSRRSLHLHSQWWLTEETKFRGGLLLGGSITSGPGLSGTIVRPEYYKSKIRLNRWCNISLLASVPGMHVRLNEVSCMDRPSAVGTETLENPQGYSRKISPTLVVHCVGSAAVPN
jgi:hypothetical protein